MRNIAVVLAGGFGQRLGDATPKLKESQGTPHQT